MKVYHQTGFRENWNIDIYKLGIGDGLIFSPVNIDSDKLLNLELEVKKSGFLDPQLYLLNEAKGNLHTYPYFPGNIKPEFSTIDLDSSHHHLAQLCVDYQLENEFEYLVIPVRYNFENPTNYYIESTEYFVQPFCDYTKNKHPQKKILLSVIVKAIMLTDTERRNEVLNWITGQKDIDGVYLIFENTSPSKQIKDFDFLLYALKFIQVLKFNQLEVHVGYCNTESILYSLAMPDSITMGSYENLRSFGIKRFRDSDRTAMKSPNARLYSTKLLQWVDYTYIEAMERLLPEFHNYFDNTIYRPKMFNSEYNWHFNKPDTYKHYFEVFYNQVKSLPDFQIDRFEDVKEKIKNALVFFREIENVVLLDDNSDGSHLGTWYNVVNAFKKELGS